MLWSAKPLRHNRWATTLEPGSHNYWAHTATTEAHVPRACALQLEAIAVRSLHTVMRSSLHLPQWKKRLGKATKAQHSQN